MALTIFWNQILKRNINSSFFSTACKNIKKFEHFVLIIVYSYIQIKHYTEDQKITL